MSSEGSNPSSSVWYKDAAIEQALIYYKLLGQDVHASIWYTIRGDQKAYMWHIEDRYNRTLEIIPYGSDPSGEEAVSKTATGIDP